MEKKGVVQKFTKFICFTLLIGVLSPVVPVLADTVDSQTTQSSIQESSEKSEVESSSKEVTSSEVSSSTETTETSTTKESEEKADFSFSILHTNDMHGRMQADKDKVIGLARLKTYKDMINPTLMLDSGDAMQGLAISNFGKGIDMARAMSKLPYDAVSVGNHEFDFGYEQAMAYKNVLPMVSANVIKDGQSSFEPYKIVEKDGKKFALIGLSTPETAFKTHPNNVTGVTFKDPIPVAKELLNELKGKADVFIFLCHLGIDQTTPSEWRGDTLAKELSVSNPNDKIIVLDGHSHTALSGGQQIGNVLLAQTGNYLNNVGMIHVSYKGNTPEYKAELIPAAQFADVKEDETVKQMVDETKAKFDQEMSQVVLKNNTVQFEGNGDNVRTRETNLGNIIADSLYDYGQTGFKNGQTDVAVINGGGIRTSINKGEVTKGDILAVLPFGNTISQIDVTGKQLKDMFEYSLRSELQKDESGKVIIDETTKQPVLGRNGGFLQVSDSVKINYDPLKQGAGNKPEDNQKGERVWSIKIRNKATGEFEPIDDTKTYKLATNDFLAAGGDGYTMLGGSREEGPSLDVVFTNFLSDISNDKKEKVTPINSAKYNIADYEVAMPYSRIIPSETEVTTEQSPLDELEKTITEAKKLKETEYTAHSWTRFVAELDKAQKVLTDQDGSQALSAKDALITQKEKLVSIKSLNELVDNTSKLKETDYTTSSWKVFSKALVNANNLLKDAQSKEIELTTEDVKKIEDELDVAMKQLVKVETAKSNKGKLLPKTGEKIVSFLGAGAVLTTLVAGAYVLKNKVS